MPTSNQEPTQVVDVLNRLSLAMEQLQDRYDAAQRANRRARIALVVVLILLGGAVYHVFSPVAELAIQIPQLIPQLRKAALDHEDAAAERQRLLEMLPPDQQAEIKLLEEKERWLSSYLDAYPDFNAGAAVSLFLSQMSKSMKVMPGMYDEVRSMTAEVRSMNEKMNALPILATSTQGMHAQMNALPVLATEVKGMHFYMSLIAKDLDSTMGEAGRMMPWNW
jgi:hypothetical protein